MNMMLIVGARVRALSWPGQPIGTITHVHRPNSEKVRYNIRLIDGDLIDCGKSEVALVLGADQTRPLP